MNHPFNAPTGGFGFGPIDRRALHHQHRQARRELREHLGEHAGSDAMGPGFGPAFRGGRGAGFDPRGGFDFGFDPRGGFGFGPGPRGGRRGGRRGKRGDVRAAILSLLTERPMHGYEMIQEIAERSQNVWKPSPGSVYPTLQLLEDEGLIAAGDSEGSRKLFELTEDGRAAAAKVETPPWHGLADDIEPGEADRRNAAAQLLGAIRQAAFAASEDQQERIVAIVNKARREVYGVLGED